MPDYPKEWLEYARAWFEELNRRWIGSLEQLSLDDQHRLNYLRSAYINEIKADAIARFSDGKIVVE